MRKVLSSISLNYEYDLVAARRRGRQLAELLGFSTQEQTQIATVTSEIARNALRYAQGGRVEFAVDDESNVQWLLITVTDRGPGIANLEKVLNGDYVSRTGMGIGIVGARRLMDDFQISSQEGSGTDVQMKKRLPRTAPRLTADGIKKIVDEL